jgi:hypothetical protein
LFQRLWYENSCFLLIACISLNNCCHFSACYSVCTKQKWEPYMEIIYIYMTLKPLDDCFK